MTQQHEIDELDLVAYARGLVGQHGGYAAHYAAKRAKELQDVGDAWGHDVWMRVSALIARPQDF